jgi:CheY-like chemotaxis protein
MDLWDRLRQAIPGLLLNGHPTQRLPNTLNVSFPGVSGSAVLARAAGIAASTGSACHAGGESPSSVLTAMGLAASTAPGAVRLYHEHRDHPGIRTKRRLWARLLRSALGTETMCRLHDEGRDHIWGYYIRNLARPEWLAQKDNRADVLIGNPPWLSYRFMPAEMQKLFREMSDARRLWTGAKVATHQDLSALFVARAVELSMSFITASSATEALTHIESGREFAALLTDVHIPGMSGLELAATVRARGLRIPIVFLTAVPHTTGVFAEGDGAAWCLGKPVSSEDFARMVTEPPRRVAAVQVTKCSALQIGVASSTNLEAVVTPPPTALKAVVTPPPTNLEAVVTPPPTNLEAVVTHRPPTRRRWSRHRAPPR